jgi:hypothetical protein
MRGEVRYGGDRDSRNARVNDDRVVCHNCGRRMVPRLITYRGDVERTVCPFCASTYQEFAPTFPRVLAWILAIVLCVVFSQSGL